MVSIPQLKHNFVRKNYVLKLILIPFVYFLAGLTFATYGQFTADHVANLMFTKWWGKSLIYVPFLDNFIIHNLWYFLFQLWIHDPTQLFIVLSSANLFLGVTGIWLFLDLLEKKLSVNVKRKWLFPLSVAVLSFIAINPTVIRFLGHLYLRGGLEFILLFLIFYAWLRRAFRKKLFFFLGSLVLGVMAYSDFYYHLFLLFPLVFLFIFEHLTRIRPIDLQRKIAVGMITLSTLLGFLLHAIGRYIWGYVDVRSGIRPVPFGEILERIELLGRSLLYIFGLSLHGDVKDLNLVGIVNLVILITILLVTAKSLFKKDWKGSVVRYVYIVGVSTFLGVFTTQYVDLASARYMLAFALLFTGLLLFVLYELQNINKKLSYIVLILVLFLVGFRTYYMITSRQSQLLNNIKYWQTRTEVVDNYLNFIRTKFDVNPSYVAGNYWTAVMIRYLSKESVNAVQVICRETELVPYRWLGVEEWFKVVNSSGNFVLLVDRFNQEECKEYLNHLEERKQILTRTLLPDGTEAYLIQAIKDAKE